MQIFLKSGEYVSKILPGVQLFYGGLDLISKIIALLCSLFLIIGVKRDVFHYMLCKVRSVTTDFGTEIGISAPSLLEPFLKYISGHKVESLGVVAPNSRMLP